jgi:hypothetical protein
MLALSSVIANAAPFSNGSFETGSPSNGLLTTGDSSSIPSWVVGGTNGTIEFNSPGFNGQTAQDGNNFISFGHNTTTGGTLSQTFDTVIGAVYTVNYFVSRIQGGTSAQGMSVTALNATTSAILGLTGTTIPATNNLWTAGSPLMFTATSTSTILRFTDITAAGGGGDSNWALDNVTLSVAPTGPAGVPDTGSTISLLALAAGAVAFVARFGLRRAHA